MAAILSVARKQYSLLKAANLLTPDMISEFEELERLVHQEAGASLEQALLPNRPTDAQGTQQGCDSKDLGQLVLSPLPFLGAQHVLEGCFGGDACGRVQLPAVGTGRELSFLLTRCLAGNSESSSQPCCRAFQASQHLWQPGAW